MNTIARTLPIFVLMAAAAMTALTIGATATFAASNTHTHDIQLMDKDESWPSSFTHTPVNWTGEVGSDDFGGFNSARYGVQPHHHHSSTNMIADSSGNSNRPVGDFGDFNSAQYGVQPHHHHSSMIADYNGDNSNNTAGSDERGGFSSTLYGSPDSQPNHHKDSTPNSSWMWPTHHTAPDDVDTP